MQTGWTMIQQTLTTEVVDVLNQSVAEAAGRSHAQTTPLHVAATLLASPTGSLRQACVRSQSNSSHPLQCRALELCFSVAVDRLPSKKQKGRTDSNPPISNALMAALKRAQANQRKGCSEQMQHHLPIKAIKVEVEQLIVAILDDPSVSRVMKEARFSSSTVKTVIEQSNASVSPYSSYLPLISSTVSSSLFSSSSSVGLGFPKPTTLLPTNRTRYINPKLFGLEQTQTAVLPIPLNKSRGIGILSSSVESLLTSKTTDPCRKTACRPGQKTMVRKPLQPVFSSSESCFFQANDAPIMTDQNPYYSAPMSLVNKDLALGRLMEENHENRIKDRSESTNDFFFSSGQQSEKSSGDFDSESFKKLLKGLTEKISWQPEAASAVATIVSRFKSGAGISAQRKKSDTWILFLGPDKVGKKKMASSLSELLFGNDPTTVTLGDSTEIRKQTTLDWIADAAWRNPFSVFVIENVEQADTLVRFRIKQAIKSGRITASNGREVCLGSAIFILTANSPPSPAANLESIVRENTKKRHRNELSSTDIDVKAKSRIESPEPKLSLDLQLGNLCGDPTVENVNVIEDRYERLMMKRRPSSTLPMDMIEAVDDVIIFKAVDL